MKQELSRKDRLNQTAALLDKVQKLKTEHRKLFFEPYEKQQAFFDNGLTLRERLLMAGNQLGKSEAGAYETACHLTGDYPDWWLGRRFDKPTKGWAAGETSTLVRDVQQKKLCGEPGVTSAFGTGMIPKDRFLDTPSLARGVTDAFDTIQVRHKSGGISVLRFKSYEQGRTKFQGETLDFVWCDEEPPMEIYSECLTRVTATKGMVFVTFTPLKGMSTVVNRYLNEPSPDRGVTIMTIYDVKHISPEEREQIIAGYPSHEREARTKGTPMLGSGRIFPYSEESLWEDQTQHIPLEWTKLWGIDFGIDHPFAAVLTLWDKDADIIHVHHTIRVADQLPLQHSVPMKTMAARVPVAWPQDGTSRESSGDQLAVAYKKCGVLMLPSHATWESGGYSTEAGIIEMQDRMTTGRLKIARHLSDWWEEFRMYHRKDGQIVKIRDDLMSATRIALMAKRHGRPVPLGGEALKRRKNAIAEGVDFDVFE